MQINKNLILTRENNKPILIDTFCSEDYDQQPIAIFCHGYKGYKDWGAWNLMAKAIANAGICVVKFNFSHNGGTIEQPIDFPDLEAFGQNNYTKELDDLNDVIDWVSRQFNDISYIDNSNISLIGHSRGSGIAILKAAEDKRVKKLISLAGVSDFEIRFGSEEEIRTWKASGVKYIVNGRTKQQMPHYYQFHEDFLKNRQRLNIQRATRHIDIPHLIIHGDKDNTVKIEEAQAVHKWNPKSKLFIVKNADHVFNTKQPWTNEDVSPELNLAIAKMASFLK
jgi:pimeloyl-ACP methyl ester carboxylesterase